jgi:hypothetical protein
VGAFMFRTSIIVNRRGRSWRGTKATGTTRRRATMRFAHNAGRRGGQCEQHQGCCEGRHGEDRLGQLQVQGPAFRVESVAGSGI